MAEQEIRYKLTQKKKSHRQLKKYIQTHLFSNCDHEEEITIQLVCLSSFSLTSLIYKW